MQFAFFGRDGGIDEAAMRRQVEASVAAGAHGIAILGLATEVDKLSPAEWRLVLDCVAGALDGRAPLAVTVAGPDIDEQATLARAAQAAGAAWLILQPPRGGSRKEADLLGFFGKVAAAVDLPVAVQNAPGYLGCGLSNAALAELHRRCPNVRAVKWEGPAVEVRRLIEETGGRLAVFNGRDGLELPDNLRAGCAGVIATTDTMDLQVRIFDLMRAGASGPEAQAERLYARILPLIVFLMQSIDTLICYGKRAAARRLGIPAVHDRPPFMAPTRFGLSLLDRYLEGLQPYP